MHLSLAVALSAGLFGVGSYGVLARRNAIAVLMAVELMLNAAVLDLIAFDSWLRDTLHAGQSFGLFVIVIAAAEIGVGFAIVLAVYRLRGSVAIDRLDDLGERDPVRGDPLGTGTAGQP